MSRSARSTACLPAGPDWSGWRSASPAVREEEWLLGELGLDVHRVSSALLNEDPTVLDGLDVLYAPTALNWGPDGSGSNPPMGAEAQTAFRAWLDGGGGYVAAGTGFTTLTAAGAVDGLVRQGAPSAANGVLGITNAQDSDVVPGRPEEAVSFAYPPGWFTALPEGFTVEQRFREGDTVLVAGHWPEAGPDEGEPDQRQAAAAGQPLTVAGELETGGRLVATGASPLFRGYTVGLFDELVDWMLWTLDAPATDEDLGVPYVPPVGPGPGPDPPRTPGTRPTRTPTPRTRPTRTRARTRARPTRPSPGPTRRTRAPSRGARPPWSASLARPASTRRWSCHGHRSSRPTPWS